MRVATPTHRVTHKEKSGDDREKREREKKRERKSHIVRRLVSGII